jgi:hypothetical protein
MRIGELSRELEKDKTFHGSQHKEATSERSELTKEQTLASAGIAVSTAHDYEQLAGGKEKRVREVAVTAAPPAASWCLCDGV